MLLGIALFLIYTAESSARSVREARIARLKANAEMAQYAAEAGFNRVRARIVGNAGYSNVLNLHGEGETLASGAFYTIDVVGVDEENFIVYVRSAGVYGEGTVRAERVVSGSIQKIVPPTCNGLNIRCKTKTSYD